MSLEPERTQKHVLLQISVLQALLKGFSVFYFLLLPILYATGNITPEQLGYIGALLIAGILVGALAVTYKLHTYNKKVLLNASLLLLFGSTLLLFWFTDTAVLATAYVLIGLATGLGMSAINALAAQFTTQGKRFKALAKMAMLTDVVRIVYPLIVGLIYIAFGFIGLIYFALFTVLGFGLFALHFSRSYRVDEVRIAPNERLNFTSIHDNKPFWFVIRIEFLDSFASSQLFVFLPVLLVFKNFTIENALVMQSAVFMGYLSGRWLVGALAHRFNGFTAVGLAETGMIATIILLLAVPPSVLVYALCFLLGVFSRGTSPVIKALAFDRLRPEQIKQGSAIHVIGGDSGSAIGQLIFGLLLAWLGVTAPFIGAAICAAVVAIICLTYSGRTSMTTY